MKSLIVKDFRLYMTVLVLGIVLLVSPYIFACLTKMIVSANPHSNISWTQTVATASLLALRLAWVTAACLGGCAIAGERQDSSDQFLAYLPPKRTTIIASKIIVSAVPVVCVEVISLSVFFVAYAYSGFQLQVSDFREYLSIKIAAIIAAGVLVFGTSWFCSCFAERSLYAVLLGLGGMVAVWVPINALRMLGIFTFPVSLVMYAGVAALIGIFSFIVGTVIFLLQPRIRC